MPRVVFTPEVVALVREKSAEAWTPAAIAAYVGSTEPSLKVKCSQLGIPLGKRALSFRQVSVSVTQRAYETLRQAAFDRGTTDRVLASRVLEMVLQDDLIAAVLDT